MLLRRADGSVLGQVAAAVHRGASALGADLHHRRQRPGVKDYQFAILVFAVTLAVSGVGLLIYRAICRRHERKQQEHE